MAIPLYFTDRESLTDTLLFASLLLTFALMDVSDIFCSYCCLPNLGGSN